MSVLGQQAIVHRLGEGQANHAFLTRHFRLTPDETGGVMALWEEEIPEGVGPPLHAHHDAQELFVVLEGNVRFRCSGRDVDVGPGATVLIPQRAEHTFKGLGPGTARVLVQLVPGRGIGFFRDTEGLSPETDMDAIRKIARKYDLEFVGPPI